MNSRNAVVEFFKLNGPRTDLEFSLFKNNFKQLGYTEVDDMRERQNLTEKGMEVIPMINPSTNTAVYFVQVPESEKAKTPQEVIFPRRFNDYDGDDSPYPNAEYWLIS